MIVKLFKKRKECTHPQVRPDVDCAYCPDCGELIENQWYMLRCACCGVKIKGIIKNGEILPEKQFCHNCGNKKFTVEKINKINFIDINYAVLVKTIAKNEDFSQTQSWIDFKTENYKPKLLQQYL